MARPEHQAPPELFYDGDAAGKYTSNSRVNVIQAQMAERCIELLNFAPGERCLVLDLGCGTGLSGDALVAAGHAWIGVDVSDAMLRVAVERGCGAGGGAGGDMLLGDMGQGFGLRAGTVDGAISVSALQWLCYADRTGHRAGRRLGAFFASLYKVLRRGARAALQFYPESAAQIELITAVAHRAGFTGGLVVDNPESTKAKKYYLCIFAGSDSAVGVRERGLAGGASAVDAGAADDGMSQDEEGEGDEDGGDEDSDAGSSTGDGDVHVASRGGGRGRAVGGSGGTAQSSVRVGFEQRRGDADAAKKAEKASRRRARAAAKPPKAKSRAWINLKKDAARRKGLEGVRPDSKYTGRKRGPKF
jgi:18S rRNA (guanine1575-N7)-methyltransferase